MYVLAGLGNPGGKYLLNRHNIGFMFIDSIATFYQFPPFKKKFNALISEGKIGLHRVLICKPFIYMNLSGHSLEEVMTFYKIPPCHLYVVHDDLNLSPRTVKVKKGGGHGGHNGLRNIDQCLGVEYWRIRLGIGHPGVKEDVLNHVLGNFSTIELTWVYPFLTMITKQISSLLGNPPHQWLSSLQQELS